MNDKIKELEELAVLLSSSDSDEDKALASCLYALLGAYLSGEIIPLMYLLAKDTEQRLKDLKKRIK